MAPSTRISKRALLKGAGVMTLAGLAGCTTTAVLAPPGDGGDETEASLGMVNALRREHGLRPLVRDPQAARAALAQAARMARSGKMHHLIGFNDSFLARMKGQSVALPAAENIAAGQPDAKNAYLAWLNSPKHRENMLGPSYSGLGVAVMRDAGSGNRPYWAVVLSSPA